MVVTVTNYIGETAFVVWLLIKGGKTPSKDVRASESAKTDLNEIK